LFIHPLNLSLSLSLSLSLLHSQSDKTMKTKHSTLQSHSLIHSLTLSLLLGICVPIMRSCCLCCKGYREKLGMKTNATPYILLFYKVFGHRVKRMDTRIVITWSGVQCNGKTRKVVGEVLSSLPCLVVALIGGKIIEKNRKSKPKRVFRRRVGSFACVLLLGDDLVARYFGNALA
jgi:hypothetical protein